MTAVRSELKQLLQDVDANVRYKALLRIAALDTEGARQVLAETHIISPTLLNDSSAPLSVSLRDGNTVKVNSDGNHPGMVLVPAGVFYVGDDSFPDNPRREAHTNGFWVDIFPVTNSEFEAVLPEHKERRSPFSPYDDGPVVNVSWEEAESYCRKVGKRLLSELEWEKVAGGPMCLKYPYGDEYDSAKARVGLDANAGTARVNTVYGESASGYGVFDLSGNVWEWTSSWFDEDHRKHVIKGGCWSSGPRFCLNAYRFGEFAHFRYVNLGFRCASDG